MRFFAVIVSALVCAACSSMSGRPAAIPATGTALPAWEERTVLYRARPAGEGQVYVLDATRSDIRIYAFRGGVRQNLGHSHVLTAPQAEGLLWFVAADWRELRADVRLRLDQLQLDDPALRAATGGRFATEVAADARTATRTNMLGDGNLQADQHPLIELSIRTAGGDDPIGVVTVQMQMHGVVREQLVPVRIAAAGDTVEVRGALAFRQSDFGVRPFTILGGLLAMQDEVAVEFKLVGVKTPAR